MIGAGPVALGQQQVVPYRHWLAGLALEGILAAGSTPPERAAQDALQAADALLDLLAAERQGGPIPAPSGYLDLDALEAAVDPPDW